MFSGNMLRLYFFALFCASTSAASVPSEQTTFTNYGMKMAVRAYDLVCWYENLKQFPTTNSNGFLKCNGQAEGQRKSIVDQMTDEDEQQKYFGEWLISLNLMAALPSQYSNDCNKYLEKSQAKSDPPADESDVLRDNEKEVYPFKAFAYCLMHTLRTKFGDNAIEAIKDEKTYKMKHWMTTLLERENEFRTRHGVNSLNLIKDLNDQAQRWADKLASECNSYHSPEGYPDAKFQGEGTGESLSSNGGKKDDPASAYIATDGWYEENKDYPWPAYTGDGNDAQFEGIGHFTQSVWKESKYVGYGLSYNPACEGKSPYTTYIVARYFPSGNMPGSFKKNVLPPKKE